MMLRKPPPIIRPFFHHLLGQLQLSPITSVLYARLHISSILPIFVNLAL